MLLRSRGFCRRRHSKPAMRSTSSCSNTLLGSKYSLKSRTQRLKLCGILVENHDIGAGKPVLDSIHLRTSFSRLGLRTCAASRIGTVSFELSSRRAKLKLLSYKSE